MVFVMLSLERQITHTLSNICVALLKSKGILMDLDTTSIRAQVDTPNQGWLHKLGPRSSFTRSG